MVLSSEKHFYQANQHLFRRKLRQRQRQQRQNGGDSQERDIIECERNQSHPAHDRVAIAEIRESLNIFSEGFTDLWAATSNPLLLKVKHISAGQQTVVGPISTLGTIQLRRKHHERAE